MWRSLHIVYSFHFRHVGDMKNHYAIIGMAHVAINIVNTPFSEQLPLAQLHWIVADENESITVESMSDGLHIYDNPVGVLTNNPPFPQQMFMEK